jgi:hypothetical protein
VRERPPPCFLISREFSTTCEFPLRLLLSGTVSQIQKAA